LFSRSKSVARLQGLAPLSKQESQNAEGTFFVDEEAR
jgi:hypothetical protein